MHTHMHTHALSDIKIWMFWLTLTIYKRLMQIGWVFFQLLYWNDCYLGTQHFEKEIKCDLQSSDPANSSLQILFIFWGVRILHMIILQHFIILIFFKHIRISHTLAKTSTRQDLMNRWTTPGVTAVLRTITLYKVVQCKWSCWKAASLDN